MAQVGGPQGGYGFTTSAEAEAKAARAKRTKIAIAVLLGVAAIVLSAAVNPPTGSNHFFTKQSDYREKRESGCTNSGKGCHGSETAYRDFNDYHPDAKCTTCHEYQGAGCIPCHSPSKNHECPTCHDGSMENAPDTVRLSDPYPRGHYRETTHTAMGTDMGTSAYSALGGEAKAPCKTCHSRDLKEAHTGVVFGVKSPYRGDDELGCGACHNDKESFGQKTVLANWEQRDCASCHKQGSSEPQHVAKKAKPVAATGTWKCGQSGSGCHASDNLHAIHANAPKDCTGSAEKGEGVCHTAGKEALKPKARTCGGESDRACHQGPDSENGYKHKAEGVHSPDTQFPASDTSYNATPCGGCHRMEPDGVSLIDEHALATSVKSTDGSNGCLNCHDNAASEATIVDKWPLRDTDAVCSTCHGTEGLDAEHPGDFEGLHTVASGSTGCAVSGAGCHPTANLSEVGSPTVTANIHANCLRCHDWREAGGNLAYDPASKTCGSGRDCHSGTGEFDPSSGVHVSDAGRTDGRDADHHLAGAAQGGAVWQDPAAGTSTACDKCHGMILGIEHTRPNNSIATGTGTVCLRCHNKTVSTAGVVKASWPKKNSSAACTSCHGTPGTGAQHSGIDAAHKAVMKTPTGTVDAAFCTRTGCHLTTDLRKLHAAGAGCNTEGCHQATGNIFVSKIKTCGGDDPSTSCHPLYEPLNHFKNHRADLSGTVDGVTYVNGRNVGCFGCHSTDLRTEHSTALAAGSMEGAKPGQTQPCQTCHERPGDTNVNTNASLPTVKAAILGHDHRCVACHANGTDSDSTTSLAGPHKSISASNPLPAGFVWGDPLLDWQAAMSAPTGAGHNISLDDSVLPGASTMAWPETAVSINATDYVWTLPRNAGSTVWLRSRPLTGDPALAIPGPDRGWAVDTTPGIQAAHVVCSDCHWYGAAEASARGPQGAAVKIQIDPNYAQSEWANPTQNSVPADPFDVANDPARGGPSARPGNHPPNPAGYKPVVCYKCHQVFVGFAGGANPGTMTVGGNGRHSTHRWHGAASDWTTRAADPRYSNKCTDCHVRIPHAWKRPRLLISTQSTDPVTGAFTGDTFPYVLPGAFGLQGVRRSQSGVMVNYNGTVSTGRQNCATGGCYDSTSTTTNHPQPALGQTPGWQYWP